MYNNFMSKPIILENQILLLNNYKNENQTNKKIKYVYIKIKSRINSRRTAARTKHYETRVISKIKRARIYSNECFHNINSINFKDESFTKINLKNGLIGIKFFYHNILFITYSLIEY